MAKATYSQRQGSNDCREHVICIKISFKRIRNHDWVKTFNCPALSVGRSDMYQLGHSSSLAPADAHQRAGQTSSLKFWNESFLVLDKFGWFYKYAFSHMLTPWKFESSTPLGWSLTTYDVICTVPPRTPPSIPKAASFAFDHAELADQWAKHPSQSQQIVVHEQNGRPVVVSQDTWEPTHKVTGLSGVWLQSDAESPAI